MFEKHRPRQQYHPRPARRTRPEVGAVRFRARRAPARFPRDHADGVRGTAGGLRRMRDRLGAWLFHRTVPVDAAGQCSGSPFEVYLYPRWAQAIVSVRSAVKRRPDDLHRQREAPPSWRREAWTVSRRGSESLRAQVRPRCDGARECRGRHPVRSPAPSRRRYLFPMGAIEKFDRPRTRAFPPDSVVQPLGARPVETRGTGR